jgi:hypothetical protein
MAEFIKWHSASERSLSVDPAWGIAVAADSELATFEVAGLGLVGPGSPLLCNGGRPLTSAKVTIPRPDRAVEGLCSLVVATCPQELAALPRGRAERWYGGLYAAGTADGTVLEVPWYGRRTGMLYYNLGETGSITITGRKGPDASHDAQIGATISQTGTTGGAQFVGGFGDEMEAWDVLRIVVAVGSTWGGKLRFLVDRDG